MKQISKMRCETPRNRAVPRRSESPMATPGRSGLLESHRAGRSILPKWKRIFLTLLPSKPPEERVLDSPGGRILDKIGQNWTQVAKIGQGWPNLDKAGQIWTAGGQLFTSVLGYWEQSEECKAKTPALFLAGLRGPDSDRPLRSGNATTKKRPPKPVLSKISQIPIDGDSAAKSRYAAKRKRYDHDMVQKQTPP